MSIGESKSPQQSDKINAIGSSANVKHSNIGQRVPASVVDKENTSSLDIDLKDPTTDLMTLAQREELERRIIMANPELVMSRPLPLVETLQTEFSHDTSYLRKVAELGTKYCQLRRVRPDGNCFFRSIAFAYCQRLIEPQMRREWLRFRQAVTDIKARMLDELNFPEMTVQDFYENFMDFLDKCHPPPIDRELNGMPDVCSDAEDCMQPSELMAIFNEQSSSDYIVVFLRLVTSAYMQLNADFYACFIEDGVSVSQFCAKHVEPMYQDSDHVHISALTQATGIAVQIMYLDRGSQSEASELRFPEDKEPLVHLLYRPGHYEIIYPLAHG